MANVSSSNSQKALVPKLRFHDANGAEFPQLTSETVGTLFSHISRRNSDMKNNNVITNSAEFGLIPQRDFFDKDIAVEGNTDKYYIIGRGDFVYNPRKSTTAPYGPFNCYQGEEEGIVSPLYTCLKPLYPEMADYLLWYFRSPAWYSYIYHNGTQGGARHDRVGMTNELMDGIPVNLPCKTEQKKINDFLTLLDKRITAQQQLVEALKSYKRGALSKLFPQEGSSVPEYRFAGFNGDWEQRRLSDLAEKTYGGGTPATSNEAFWNGTIPWIQSSDIADGKLFGVVPRKYITDEALNKSATQLVPENSIAIITRVGVGKLAFMPFPYTTSQDFLSLSKLNTEPFFTVYACYKKIQSELNAVQGTSIKGITKDELLAKAIMVPKFKEQQQIGGFFRSLDNLITITQCKLNKYEQIKVGLLQTLFI